MKEIVSKLKKSSLVKETKWVLIGNLATMLFSTLFTFYSANKLGPSLYGLVAIIMSSVLILQEILSFRTWEAVIKIGTEKLHISKLQFKNTFLSFVLFDLCLYILVFLIVFVGNQFIQIYIIKQDDYDYEIFLYSLIVLLAFNKGTFSAFLRIFRRYEINSMIVTISGFIRLASGVIMMSYSPTIESFFYANLISTFVSFILYILYVVKVAGQNNIKLTKEFPSFRECYNIIIESKAFLFTTYWVSTLKTGTSRVLVIIMSFFLTAEHIGVYKLLRDILTIFNLAVTDTLYNIAYPRFASTVKKDKKQTYGLIKFLNIYGIIGILGYGLVVFLFGDYIIVLFFKQYIDVIPLLKLALFELLLVIQPSWIVPLIMCLNLNKENLIARFINSFTLIVLVFLLTPLWGVVGVEIAFIFSSLIYVVYLLIVANSSLRRLKFENE